MATFAQALSGIFNVVTSVSNSTVSVVNAAGTAAAALNTWAENTAESAFVSGVDTLEAHLENTRHKFTADNLRRLDNAAALIQGNPQRAAAYEEGLARFDKALEAARAKRMKATATAG